jgi:hypothetical protein
MAVEGWMSTYSGKRFDINNPTADMICIEDIIQSLSNKCRFNGHCKEFYSVAQHSMLVCIGGKTEIEKLHGWMADKVLDESCPGMTLKKLQLDLLLHDATEPYVSDVVRPLKYQPWMAEYRAFEKKVEKIIREKFGLSDDPKIMGFIKHHDDRALATEARQLMVNEGKDWDCINGVEPYDYQIPYMDPRDARRLFTTLYHSLI